MYAAGPIPTDETRSLPAAGPRRTGTAPARRKRRNSKAGTVQDYLVQRILKGQLPGDRKLPSEASLERRFNVSRVTVRAAISTLRDAGLVYSFQGAGHFARPVRMSIDPERFAPLYDVFAAFGDQVERHPTGDLPVLGDGEARQLGVPAGDGDVRRGCLVCLGGVPLCADMLVTNEAIAAPLDRLWMDGALGQTSAGSPAAGFEASAFTDNVFAPDAVGRLLKLGRGAAVMRQSLILRSNTGSFAALARRYVHPDLVIVPAGERCGR